MHPLDATAYRRIASTSSDVGVVDVRLADRPPHLPVSGTLSAGSILDMSREEQYFSGASLPAASASEPFVVLVGSFHHFGGGLLSSREYYRGLIRTNSYSKSIPSRFQLSTR